MLKLGEFTFFLITKKDSLRGMTRFMSFWLSPLLSPCLPLTIILMCRIHSNKTTLNVWEKSEQTSVVTRNSSKKAPHCGKQLINTVDALENESGCVSQKSSNGEWCVSQIAPHSHLVHYFYGNPEIEYPAYHQQHLIILNSPRNRTGVKIKPWRTSDKRQWLMQL